MTKDSLYSEFPNDSVFRSKWSI